MSISGRDPETSRRRLQQEKIGIRRFQVSLGEMEDPDTKSRAVSYLAEGATGARIERAIDKKNGIKTKKTKGAAAFILAKRSPRPAPRP
ncbi:hypothetical protein Rru_A2713 [Rhodospirillum rubrum ATCC 11170]|uniref:Uncharacterized protein n=1 Tax=Rhodospirillum rubrum (strain ATCC 11170 / ATH 1.1.1 / DSM 467 / LMG 4362 / NCIMB 8255 / S1) TaxID=269796 RepID=Q2RQT5_RHORT|nr:hypothetical protein Rru_A2713 [Rhodospirillum rubrum ATCC 11170]MBK5955182.1 hypothetical protein [Rhodospirillum rubrum]HAP98896.1 hypothetical protein [Rhodospirillum rubrum]HCF19233.1 hypothetical protein [Rhodospirillum rubrum]